MLSVCAHCKKSLLTYRLFSALMLFHSHNISDHPSSTSAQCKCVSLWCTLSAGLTFIQHYLCWFSIDFPLLLWLKINLRFFKKLLWDEKRIFNDFFADMKPSRSRTEKKRIFVNFMGRRWDGNGWMCMQFCIVDNWRMEKLEFETNNDC